MMYNDDGLDMIADQIIITAAKDYMKILKAIKKNPSNEKALRAKKKLDDFFNSDYCKKISRANPKKIVRMCKESI